MNSFMDEHQDGGELVGAKLCAADGDIEKPASARAPDRRSNRGPG